MAFVITGVVSVVAGLGLMWRIVDRRVRLLGVVLVLGGAGILYASRASEDRSEELAARNTALCRGVAGTLDVFRMTYQSSDFPGLAMEKRNEWSGMGEIVLLMIGHCVSSEGLDSCFHSFGLAVPFTPKFSEHIDEVIHGLTTGLPCK